jgi:lipopolysaccharide biosynthesis glycosyltransferase
MSPTYEQNMTSNGGYQLVRFLRETFCRAFFADYFGKKPSELIHSDDVITELLNQLAMYSSKQLYCGDI